MFHFVFVSGGFGFPFFVDRKRAGLKPPVWRWETMSKDACLQRACLAEKAASRLSLNFVLFWDRCRAAARR